MINAHSFALRLPPETPRPVRGFTLFEVAVSILIVSLAVSSVLMVFPVGIRQQQRVRCQLLAAAKALELVDLFGNQSSIERRADFELPQPWEGNPFCYSSTRWDLETRLCNWDSGIHPIPTAIARRIDSDGDEIRRLLDAGGQLYYVDPVMVPSIDYKFKNPAPPNEAQLLVFAVVGAAQHNAITIFPYKAWPYRAAYPSPPGYMKFDDKTWNQPKDRFKSGAYDLIEGWTGSDPNDPGKGGLPPRDPALTTLFKAFVAYCDKPNTVSAFSPSKSLPLAKAALDFCKAKAKTLQPLQGLLLPEYDTYIAVKPGADLDTLGRLGREYDDAFAAACHEAETTSAEVVSGLPDLKARMRSALAMRVQCFRFLASAMATYNQADSSNGKVNPKDLSTIPPIDGVQLSTQLLQYWHDRCMATVMRYAASFPNDWGAPRPIARSIMMDQPLFEFDLFTPPRTGTISGSSVTAAMWRPIAGQALTNPGLPAMYPGVMDGNTFNNYASPFPAWNERGLDQTNPKRLWGNARHFTLTRRFAPAERCRQLVFWSVDWRAFEDAETAPSAPVDASRAPICALLKNSTNYAQRCLKGKGMNSDDTFFLNNPERWLTFKEPVDELPTGSDVKDKMMERGAVASTTPDFFLGIHGADRNHNFQLDRGNLKPTVNVRAITLVRFNYYDPRLPLVFR